MKKQKKAHQLFPSGAMEHVSIIRDGDDVFFEEAFYEKAKTQQKPAKQFIGSIINKKRLSLAFIGSLCLLGVFLLKASFMQIIQATHYQALAENNRIRTKVIPSKRGIIYDSQGTILAQNDPIFRLVYTPHASTLKIENTEKVIFDLSQLLDLNAVQISKKIEENTENEIISIAEVTYEQALLFDIHQHDFPNIDLEVDTIRTYITDEIPSLSHVIGYTAPLSEEQFEFYKDQNYRKFDHIGKQGIEAYYEEILRGSYGEEKLEVDALGDIEKTISQLEPIDGENLYLTLNAMMQKELEDYIEELLQDYDASKVSVLASNPQTGAIYSLISWPAFDANLFTQGISEEDYRSLLEDENNPLFARAISGTFPSGSTIKPVYGAAALIEGIITPQTSILSSGGISVGPWFFPDWKAGGHGMTNIYHAIADSVNTFYYLIGGGKDDFHGLGIEKLMEYAEKFGFGSKTGIDLTGEANGFLPSKEWKWNVKGEQWYIGDTYNNAIGQGDFLATPIQVLLSTMVIANNGVMAKPHLNQYAPIDETEIIPKNVAEIIQNAMRRTITHGTAQSLFNLPIEVAGKTGTAQWSSLHEDHTWFTGFGPFDDPKIAVTVLVEEGGEDYLAVPIAGKVFELWLKYQNQETNTEL